MTAEPEKREEPGSWRDATTFQQGERYRGEPAEGAEPRRNAADLRRLFLAGGAMLAVTLVVRLLVDAPWLAFFAGLVVFGAALWFTRPGGAAAREDAARRRQADAAPEPVREALAEAEEELALIDAAAARLAARAGGPALAAKLAEVSAAGRGVLAAVLEDPDDYDRARKFFKALLPRARAAAEKFEAQKVADAALDARFAALADDVAAAFRRQEESLRADERVDLEVEMEVLADRVRAS